MNKPLFQKSALVAFLVLVAVIVLSTRYQIATTGEGIIAWRLDNVDR